MSEGARSHRASGVVIRLGSDNDADAAGEIAAQAYLFDALVSQDSPYLPELRDAGRRIANAELWVATVDGRLAGLGHVLPARLVVSRARGRR